MYHIRQHHQFSDRFLPHNQHIYIRHQRDQKNRSRMEALMASCRSEHGHGEQREDDQQEASPHGAQATGAATRKTGHRGLNVRRKTGTARRRRICRWCWYWCWCGCRGRSWNWNRVGSLVACTLQGKPHVVDAADLTKSRVDLIQRCAATYNPISPSQNSTFRDQTPREVLPKSSLHRT